MNRTRLNELLGAARGKRVLCIGDLMLDRFVYGEVSRISPEAPVAILRQSRDVSMPGGAGNVARNLVSLGLKVTLAGVAGRDAEGDALLASLEDLGVATDAVIRDGARPTTLKTRFVAGGQQMLRVDSEESRALDAAPEAALETAVLLAARSADLIVVSDYAKGALTDRVLQAVTQAAAARGVRIIADPKGQNFARYGAVDVLKPNAGELASAFGVAAKTDLEIEAALDLARTNLPARGIVVTRAARGMSFVEANTGVQHRAGRAREVYDVSGAGDTSLAALALGLIGGATLGEAVDFALAASGVAVGKSGTATVTDTELIAALEESGRLQNAGAVDLFEARNLIVAWREAGHSIGFTNGCFDILHPGHVRVLEEAKAHCGRLIVGLNSDASVRRLKGSTRPVNTVEARARVLAGLSAVDAVVVFEEDTPLDLVTALQPDLIVKGGDYSRESVVGADVVTARGGRVLIVPTLEGHSTTAMIARSRADET